MAPEEVMEKMTDEEFRKYVWAILNRELGPSGFARYLRTKTAGYGDYTRDRHLWLDGLTVDDVLREVGIPVPQEAFTSK